MGLGSFLKKAVNTVAKVASYSGIPVVSQAGRVVDRIIPDADTGRPTLAPATVSRQYNASTPGIAPSSGTDLARIAAGLGGALGGASTIGPIAGYGVGTATYNALAPAFGNTGSSAVPAGVGGGLIGGQIVSPSFRQTAVAPPGYRIYRVTPEASAMLGGLQPGTAVAVLKRSPAAKILGIKAPKRPVLSIRDSEALRRAARAKARVAKIAKGAGLSVYTSPRKSCAPTRKR